MKTTKYFDSRRTRSDRSFITNEWIAYVVNNPEKLEKQADGRVRKWAKIKEMDNRYLRVVVLEDNQTIHNAFFDRGFKL